MDTSDVEKQYPDDVLVKQYVDVRDSMKTLQEQLDAEADAKLEPYKKALKTIGGELQRRLLARCGNSEKKSASTDHGTFFMSSTLHVKVTDAQAFWDFVFTHNARDYLTTHVAKAAVEAYLEANKCNPPGLDTTWVDSLNVRRK